MPWLSREIAETDQLTGVASRRKIIDLHADGPRSPEPFRIIVRVADGKAVGTLSTLGLAPLPLSNNIGDLAKELAFAQAHSGIAGLTLVNGTEPFSSPI